MVPCRITCLPSPFSLLPYLICHRRLLPIFALPSRIFIPHPTIRSGLAPSPFQCAIIPPSPVPAHHFPLLVSKKKTPSRHSLDHCVPFFSPHPRVLCPKIVFSAQPIVLVPSFPSLVLLDPSLLSHRGCKCYSPSLTCCAIHTYLSPSS